MKRAIFLLPVLMSMAVSASAQEVKPSSKFGMELKMYLGQNANQPKALTRAESPRVKVLVSLVPTAGVTSTDLEAVGCEVKWAMKSVASVIVGVDQLEALASIPGVRNIELPKQAKSLNELARKVVHVDEVSDPKTAIADGLPHGYDGTGVLVGIVDNGIDYKHYAFRDEKGKLRIKKTFTHRKNNLNDEIFSIQTDPDSILNVKSLSTQSHGTHVLGIMTGRDLDNNNLQGMAPKADIVAADLAELTDENMIAGMKHLCEYAEESHKPIAINMSIGLVEGWSDGCNPVSAAMRELTDEGKKPGVIFSIAAGNEGEYNNTLVHKFTSDDEKIYVFCDTLGTRDVKEGHNIRFLHKPERVHVWADRVAENKEEMLVLFDLEKKTLVDDPDTEVAIAYVCKMEENGETKYHLFNFDYCLPAEKIVVTLRQLREILKGDDFYSSNIHTCLDGVTKKSEMYYSIDGKYVNLLENFYLGACFSYPAGTEIRVGNFSSEGKNHEEFIKPDGFDFVTIPTNDGSLNIVASNEANITSGSYTIRNQFTNVCGYDTVCAKYALNDVGYFSSYGYILDEKHLSKPDVLAPGSYILSATNGNYHKFFDDYGVLTTFYDFKKYPDLAERLALKVNIDGQNYWYDYNSGTSMAAPVTTGVIALWLQANPNLSVVDVREIFEKTSTPFKSPNTEYNPIKSSRCGIINALEGLKYIQANMTSISTLAQDRDNDGDARIFTLGGQEVKGNPAPGFYVQGGKKVVITK